MLYTKVLETTVDLFEPNEIYASDVNSLLLKHLTKRYVGYCYSSMLITKITEIIRYSDRVLVDNRLDGAGYINVQFKAEGIVLTKGEIFHGAKVTQITNSSVIINHPKVIGMMYADPTNRVFGLMRKDQIVPIIIQDMRYNISKSQITVSCLPFTPTVLPQTYYNIYNKLSVEDSAKINDLLEMIKTEMQLHDKIKTNKSYAFFKNIMYPYKTQQKFTLSQVGSKFTPVELTNRVLNEIDSGSMILPDASDEIYHSKTKLDLDNAQIIDSPVYPALSTMLLLKLNYLTALRGFVEQYSTTEEVEKNIAYWKQCLALKV